MSFQHYFVEKPEEGERIVIKDVIRGEQFIFYSTSNLFSKKHVDPGTKLLAESMTLLPNSKILDLGCGYGVLGIVAKKVCPTCEVTLVDINELAIKYSKINAKINNVSVTVLKSDVLKDINEKFDIIITNPPFTAGKEIIHRFIKESAEHLKKPGVLQLVATKKFRYVESLFKKYFKEYEIFTKKGDYIIYYAYKI